MRRTRSLIRAGLDLDTVDGLQAAIIESNTQKRALRRRLDMLRRGQRLSPVLIPDAAPNENEDSESEDNESEEESLDSDEPIVSHLRGRTREAKPPKK